MLYELRVYEAMPGKLPALLARFETITGSFFVTHGITVVGYWTTLIGPDSNALTYILAWSDLAERQQRWDAFQSDPAWQAAKRTTEQDGPLVARISSSILQPTAFSPLQ